MWSRTNADAHRPGSPSWAAILELRATGRVSEGTFGALRAEIAALPPRRADVVAGRPYAREVLFSEPGVGEVMRATWAPGASSAPHDHGGARGVVAVLEGRFEERAYAVSSGRGLSEGARRSFAAGDLIEVAEDAVHSMTSQGARGVTLHVYAGNVTSFRLFDERARVTLRARGGAWLPADVVVSEEPWERLP